MQNKLGSLVENREEQDLIDTIVVIMYEFKMGYEEVKNLPLPVYQAMIRFLNKKVEKNGRRNNNR